ncbi:MULTISPECIES: hypothetical protein [unclassified Paenibacillus]|uniref:hypothetical protein n=1 Tax=unclassified Paenibacillus TaxID=185978 RepID=UPI0030FA31F2
MDKKEDITADQPSDEEGLVTERDIDEQFGLFQEGSFPGALPDDDQQAAIDHAVPKKGQT